MQDGLNAAADKCVVIHDEYSRHSSLSPRVFDGSQRLALAKSCRSPERASNSTVLLVQIKAHRARPRGTSRLDDLILYSVTDYLADGMHLEFSHDVSPMSFGCLNAYSESHRHFLTAFPFSEKLYNFALAGCEPMPQLGFRIGY